MFAHERHRFAVLIPCDLIERVVDVHVVPNLAMPDSAFVRWLNRDVKNVAILGEYGDFSDASLVFGIRLLVAKSLEQFDK